VPENAEIKVISRKERGLRFLRRVNRMDCNTINLADVYEEFAETAGGSPPRTSSPKAPVDSGGSAAV